MAISVCPGDEVNASVDEVWSLLDDPARFDVWWDARVLEATPPGPLAPGQHIEAKAKGPFRTLERRRSSSPRSRSRYGTTRSTRSG